MREPEVSTESRSGKRRSLHASIAVVLASGLVAAGSLTGATADDTPVTPGGDVAAPADQAPAADPAAPIDPAPADPAPVDPAPVAPTPDPAPVAPEPVAPSPSPAPVGGGAAAPSPLQVPTTPKPKTPTATPSLPDAPTHGGKAPGPGSSTPSKPAAPSVTNGGGTQGNQGPGGDTGPVGSSVRFAVPAVTFHFVPTPADLRFLYHRTVAKPKALPKLKTIDHELAVQFATAGNSLGVHPAILLAIARRESNLGRTPGLLVGARIPGISSDHSQQLVTLAQHLKAHGANRVIASKGTKTALIEYFGDKKIAHRIMTLAAFYGALGMDGMQHGLAHAETDLAKRILKDKRIKIYKGGRSDINPKNRRVDARVLLTIEYLANATKGKLEISSLVSGESPFTPSGKVTAAYYGRAMKISKVGGVKVKGHQNPGSNAEKAVKLLLVLPKNMRPVQIVSLMDLDGIGGNRGSFALGSAKDDLHIRY